MKIFAFVDFHGRINLLDRMKNKAKGCDVVVCAGDFTNFENDLNNLLLAFSDFGKPLIVVHGNHEDDVNVERACKKHKNAHFIHNSSFKIGKHIFFGYGGGGFVNEEPGFDIISKEFKKQIQKDSKVVLVTHAPPYGTLLDIIGDDHVGVISFREFLDKNTVHLMICGHLHENAKIVQNFNKKTIIINPGPDGMIIEV